MGRRRGRRMHQDLGPHGHPSRLAPPLSNTFAILLALIAALIATTPELAAAQQTTPYVATDPANIDDSARLLESQGGYDVPGTPASPGSVGSNAGWSDGAVESIPTPGESSSGDALLEELLETGKAVRTLPRTASLGRVALGGGLAGVGTFVLWEGGTYVLGRILIPPDVPAGPIWDLDNFNALEPPGTIPRQCYVNFHCTDTTSVAWAAHQPTRVISADWQSDFYYCSGGNDYGQYASPAETVGGAPQGSSVVETYSEPPRPDGLGTCGSHAWQHFSIVDPISPGEFLPAGDPFGPGGGATQSGTITTTPCTTNWPNCPTSANLTDRLADQLDSGDEPLLSRWLDYKAEPDFFADPTAPETDDESKHRCDRSDPSYNNPEYNDSPGPLTEQDPVAYTTTVRPGGATSDPDPFLRWGRSSWLRGTQDAWSGWGFRHIRAKHGWGPEDEAETRATLLAPITTSVEPENSTSMTYGGETFEANGAICRRVVTVQFAMREYEAAPRGIITSYGKYLGEAP